MRVFASSSLADDDRPAKTGGLRRTRSVIPRDVPGMQALLSLQVAVVVITAMYFGRSILIPVVLSVLLSFLLQPLVVLLRRARLGRVLSVLLSVVLALALVAGLFWLIGGQLMGLTQQLAADHATIERKLTALRQLFNGGNHLAGLDSVQNQLGRLLAGSGTASPAPGGVPVQPVRVVEPPETPETILRVLAMQLAHPLMTALVVFVVTIFVLLQREDLRDRLIRLFGTRDLHRTTLALDDAGARLSRYFLTQLAINTVFGALISGGLFALGVQSPVLWGILAALLRYVPYVGLVFSAAPVVLLAAASFPGWGHAALVLGLFVLVDQLLGQFAEPMLVGHSTGLSPLSVVLAAAFWAFLWGPLGLILSTPLTVCAVVLGRHVEPLRFLDVLLGDQPPLSPVESLYQRLLAGDLDEIENQCEALLRERSLATLFDEVAIEALRLAALDAERGVLSESRLQAMEGALDEVLDGLEEHRDAEEDNLPHMGAPGVPVLCVAGAFALDRSAARMMAIVLERHGIAARAVPGAAAVGSAETPPGTVLCLCSAGTVARLAPARAALRALRRAAPDAPVILGFWPDERPGERAGERSGGDGPRGTVSADRLVAGSRAMVRLLAEERIPAPGRGPEVTVPA